jgi:hypothetical protein
MGSKKKREKEFNKLLDKVGFPDKSAPAETLDFVDSVVTTLTLRLLSDVGSGRIPLTALQGPPGGGGPHYDHRLDLLLRYSMLAATAAADAAARDSDEE